MHPPSEKQRLSSRQVSLQRIQERGTSQRRERSKVSQNGRDEHACKSSDVASNTYYVVGVRGTHLSKCLAYTMTKATYQRKARGFRGLESMTITAGSKAAGRHSAGAGAERLWDCCGLLRPHSLSLGTHLLQQCRTS